jgi:uncharacterized protein (TIGR00304 family)
MTITASMSREWGWLLVGAGFLVVMASIVSKMTQSGASYGGVILIGPIPIVLGSSPEMAATSMILAILLMLLSFLLLQRRS